MRALVLGALPASPGSDPGDGADEAADRRRDDAVLAALAEARGRGEAGSPGETGEDDVLLLAETYPRLLQWHPVPDAEGGWALRRAGTGERRSRGAFATPAPLAAALAEGACGPALDAGRVPTVVDPACGAGALLRAALARMLAAGVPAAEAAAALHGVDLDPVAVALARAALAVDLRRAGFAGAPPRAGGDVPRLHVGDALLGAAPGAGAAAAHQAPLPEAARPAAPGADAPGADTSGAGTPRTGTPGTDTPEPDGPPSDVRGLIWHEVFPDVLAQPGVPPEPVTGWRGGFDAVLANPPWERWKVHARDWSGPAPSGLRRARAEAAATVRAAGRHPLTGRGEVNAYLPFLETCWRLLAPDGRAGVLVPAGVATDRSASALMLALVSTGSLERLRLLGEGEAGFADISSRVPIAVIDLRAGVPRGPRPAVPPAPARVVPAGAAGGWPLDAELMHLVSPNVATIPLCATPAEHELLVRTHRTRPVLLRRDGDGRPVDDVWAVRFVTPLHMSRDARHFRTAPGPGLVPLWEAKQAGLLDHRAGRAAGPRYWVPEELLAQRHPRLWERGWLLGYRNVSVSDSARTLLPCALPPVAVGNSLPLVDSPHAELLLAVLAALPTDFLLRAKHAGANLNFFKLEQVAVPAPEHFDVPGPGGRPLREHVLALLARAVRWHEDGPHALARRLGVDGRNGEGPAGGGDHGEAGALGDPCGAEREAARAGIDAAVAWALGWSREDLGTALASFRRLRDGEEAALGEFRTGRLVLSAYEGLVAEAGAAPQGGRPGVDQASRSDAPPRSIAAIRSAADDSAVG